MGVMVVHVISECTLWVTARGVDVPVEREASRMLPWSVPPAPPIGSSEHRTLSKWHAHHRVDPESVEDGCHVVDLVLLTILAGVVRRI